MIELGRVCVKTSGRDAGNYCAIVEILDKNYVVIDGNVRRRKCNVIHLELLDKILKIKAQASTENVQTAMKKEGLEVIEKKKSTKQKVKKEQPAKKEKVPKKKAAKK